MRNRSPRIAIPEPTSANAAYNGRSLPQYVGALAAAGAVAVPIALHATEAAQRRLLASCSGILLPGSPADVDPRRYGQQPLADTAAWDPLREAADDLLLGDAFAGGKPLLGICFGLQSLNVFRGGTLIQHLPQSVAAGGVDHDPGREVMEAHRVVVTAGSRLAGWVSGDSVPVNSSHHQAVDSPGRGLRVTAVSAGDGVVEALEADSPGRFLVGVQWHPERSFQHSETSRAMFAALVTAAKAWNGSAEP